MKKTTSGFTIVELLIVIVVIGILAAITVVAYNGIQNRANDAAVSSDVAALVKKIKLLEVDLGAVPPSGQRSHGTGSVFQGITFSPSKSAYYTSNEDNLFYCDGNRSGVRVYQVTAKSKSGNVYMYKSDAGFSTVTGSAASNCYSGFDASTMMYTYGWNLAGGNWFSWTNGP